MHHTWMYKCIIKCASQSRISGSRLYASYIHTSGSRIIHKWLLQDQGPGSQICASFTHASYISYIPYISGHMHSGCIIHTCIRIRVMDKCIIGRCIMVTCIKIKKICIAHAYKHQESYTHACFRTKVQYHRYVHHKHMHQSQGLSNIDKCIIHAHIRIKGHG